MRRPAPQQQAPQESPEDRDYRIKMRAYEAFPYSNQRTQRGRYEQQLYMQEQRQQGRGGGSGGDQKERLEEFKQQNLNYRARIASENRDLRTQAMRDNNWLTNATKAMTEAQQRYVASYLQRQRAWNDDQKLKGTNEPYVSPDQTQAAQDTAMFQKLFVNGAQSGIDFTNPQTPAAGGQRERPPAPGQQQPQNAPVQNGPAQQQQQPPPGATAPLPNWLPSIRLDKHQGETPPKQLTPEERQHWQWSHFEDGTGWMLVPRKKAAPAPAPTKPPVSATIDPNDPNM
jgi:hypothetical protein